MTEPTPPNFITRDEFATFSGTLAELRQLLEANDQHLRNMADRFRELSNEVSDLWKAQHQTDRSLAMLTQRLNELRPPRLNCPHCGATVQKDWTHCRMCAKPL